MPDIDTDFQKDRREEVIEYVRQKYGTDKVSNIVAIGTMKAKAAIKDVCRVYNIPFSTSNEISKLIPNSPDITLDEAWEQSPQLVTLIESDAKYQEVWEMAKEIEGLPRNISIHASGVIICSDAIAEFAPTMTVDGQAVVQFPMETAEAIGLIKMDFLGLRTLDTIDYCTRFIRERKDPDFSINNVSLNDKATFDMLSNGETAGVFQFESDGMTQYMKQMKPQSVGELAVLNAMYRPGPLDFIPDYIARKANPALTTYALDTPAVRKILGETYGLCIPEYGEIWDADTNKKIKIKDVIPGRTWTYSLNESTKKIEKRLITRLIDSGVKDVLRITLSNDEYFEVSDKHPVLTTAGWKKANRLLIGEELVYNDFDPNKIKRNTTMSVKFIEPIGQYECYDIEVENNHNFIYENIFAHNCTYQEQVMRIFQDVAGFSLGRADLVRKAMGKKKDAIMQEEFEHFKNGLHDENNNIIGTRAQGIPDEQADALLEQMKDFSKYALI